MTRRDAPNKAQRFQLIWPYSDFLLHDMGEGLADGQQVGDADRQRMAHAAALGHRPDRDASAATRFFLHDGRARNLTGGDPLARRRGASRARPLRRTCPRPTATR